MKSGWLQLFMGLLVVLLLGSYGYTYMAVNELKSDLVQRLERIEDYVIEILKNQGRK